MALIFRHVHVDAKNVFTFFMSVRPSCMSEAPTGQISMKLDTFMKNLSRKSEFG
jgi:hypothetical protein